MAGAACVGIFAGGAKMVPALAHPAVEVTTPGQVKDLLTRAGLRQGGGGELAFIEVIHAHRLTQHQHGLNARHPGEVGVHHQAPIILGRRQVVTIGITVTLREHAGGIGGINPTLRLAVRLLLNVVVEGVDDFAGIDPAGIIPDQPVVHGRHAGARQQEVIATAQQRQLFLQQVRHLALEGKHGRGHIAVLAAGRADSDRRVGRVGKSLVAQEAIEIIQITGR